MKTLLFFWLFFITPYVIAETKPLSNSTTESPLDSNLNQNTNPSDVEKIKVTGSRIKRIDIEGPNPIEVFNAEDLKTSGYHSVADFLRDTSIAPFGVSRGKAGSGDTGDSYTRIKGESALILINGLRVTKDPINQFFDLNQIPINAVERIEVLKGGAAALYGSDAIGGVINFITKKDFSGLEVAGSITPSLYPLYQGNLNSSLNDYLAGSRASTGIVFGDTSRNWSYIGTLNSRYEENIIYRQREWGKGLKSPTSPYAQAFAILEDNSTGKPIKNNCPKAEGKTSCPSFDYSPYADIMPKYFQVNSFIQGELNLSQMKIYTNFLGSYKHSHYYYPPIPVIAGVKPPLDVPADHKIQEVAGQSFRLTHRFIKADKRITTNHYFLADLTLGAKGYLSNIWDYDFNVKGTHIMRNSIEKNLLLIDKTIEAIRSGAYNPYAPSKEGLKNSIYTAKDKSNSSLFFSSLDFSGEAGGFNLATGFQAYFERYEVVGDKEKKASNILSNAGSDGLGNRYVTSYYLEAVKNLSSLLELQLAWRADYYSDFGLTSFGIREFLVKSDSSDFKFLDYLIGTPKIAFSFKPQSNILIRGNIGSSFLAPSLDQLYGSVYEDFSWMFDTTGCIADIKNLKEVEAPLTTTLKTLKENTDLIDLLVIHGKNVTEKDLSSKQKELIEKENLTSNIEKLYNSTDSCHNKQYFQSIKSNPDLKETRAIIASLGSVFEPTSNLNLSLDLTYIAKNGIAHTGTEDSTGYGKKFLDAEVLFGKEHLQKQGITLSRDGNQNLENVKTTYSNLKKSHKLFVDFALGADLERINISNGNTYFKNDLTFFIINKEEVFPGLGLENLSGKFGNPKWRNIANVGWKNKKHDISLKALSTASFSGSKISFPLTTILNLSYRYILSEKTNFQVNVYNFLNIGLNFEKEDKKENEDKNEDKKMLSASFDVPFDPGAFTLNTRTDLDIYGINGAHFQLSLTHTF
ncbi:MAG: TonB-dependent receptor [Bdellovibrionales bacterium]|nr:TonB-dependent receptor [Bdellovibrionales bacterium]